MPESNITLPDIDDVLDEPAVKERLEDTDPLDSDALPEHEREHIISAIIDHQREEHLSANRGYSDANETADRTYLQTLTNLKLTVAFAMTVAAEVYEAYKNNDDYRNKLPDHIETGEDALEHEATNIRNGDDMVYDRPSTADMVMELLKNTDNLAVSSERSEWFLNTQFDMEQDDDGFVRGINNFSDMVESTSDRNLRELSLKKPYDYDETTDQFKPLSKLDTDTDAIESLDRIHLNEVAGILSPASTSTEHVQLLIENHHTITELINQNRTTTNIKDFGANGNDVFLFADIETRHTED